LAARRSHVGFREEFPANLYPWKRLRPKGVEVTWLSIEDPLERIEEAVREASCSRSAS